MILIGIVQDLKTKKTKKPLIKFSKRTGIYWSDQKQCWVKKVKKTAEQATKVKFR